MKRGFKRVLSFAVVAAMALGGFAFVPATARAEEELPSKFDLRDRGVVTPVKMQDPWSDCWAFSGIAASEISILSELGITNEEYKNYFDGADFDLSEKHLAWYGQRPITDKTNPAQAGEGMYVKGSEGNPNYSYENGGMNLIISTLFSSCMGPVDESIFPYQGKEGLTTLQYAEKYPDKAREGAAAWAKNTLFSESFDEAYQHMHNYPTGDEATDKNVERWVDYLQSMGYMPKDQDLKAVTEDQLKDWCYQLYLDMKKKKGGDSEYSPLDDWTIPELNEEGQVNRNIYSGFTLRDGNTLPDFRVLKDDKWQGVNWEGINAAKSELMKGHGISIAFKSDTSMPGDVETGKYINLNTWAHYVYEDLGPTHAVCIVGWDDDYSAENFNEGHRPPGNGAWICKNSWGSETDWFDNGNGGTINKRVWGVKNDEGLSTGYFYLSYYDKTVVNPETFVFDTDIYGTGGLMDIWSHDFMPSLTSFDEDTGIQDTNVIKTANVFNNYNGTAERLHSVSTKTSSPGATVEYSVYKLNDNAKDPEDGELLCKKTATYEYKGFHRENIDEVIMVSPGETISIIAEETVVKDGEKLYEFTVNAAPSKESLAEDETDYGVAVVNPGESFYYSKGKWTDWKEALPKIKEIAPEASNYELDNFSIKAYLVADSLALHRLYNPNSGEHFYTIIASEKDNVVKAGWTYEGIAWTAPASSDTPVYRLYNPNSGEHFYTTKIDERDSLTPLGWRYEGIAWYSADEDAVPVYRLYNPNATGAYEAGAHFYTMDEDERDLLDELGWNYEGIGWYGE